MPTDYKSAYKELRKVRAMLQNICQDIDLDNNLEHAKIYQDLTHLRHHLFDAAQDMLNLDRSYKEGD